MLMARRIWVEWADTKKVFSWQFAGGKQSNKIESLLFLQEGFFLYLTNCELLDANCKLQTAHCLLLTFQHIPKLIPFLIKHRFRKRAKR